MTSRIEWWCADCGRNIIIGYPIRGLDGRELTDCETCKSKVAEIVKTLTPVKPEPEGSVGSSESGWTPRT